MTEKEYLSPLERAKQLIKEKGEENKSIEELAKQEEDARLDSLASRASGLFEDLAKIRGEKSSLGQKGAEVQTKINNISSGQKQAVEALKGNKDTIAYFKDKEVEEERKVHHQERRETFEQVFGESQDNKRNSKIDRREVEKDQVIADKEVSKILSKIEDLKKNPDWNKVVEKKKGEYIAANEKLNTFYKDKEKSDRLSMCRGLKKVNEFSAEYQESISTLRQELQNLFDDLLKKEETVFENAKNSPDYKPEVFGKVDFSKYLNHLPKSTSEIQFSLYSYEQRSLTLPQFDYESPVNKSIQQDIGEASNKVRECKDEINKRTGLFSGRGKFEKEKKIWEERETFLRKILTSFQNHVRDFYDKEFPTRLTFSVHDHKDSVKNMGYMVGKYISNISSNVQPLDDKEPTFPEFKRTTNIEDFFRWAKQNTIPVDWENAEKEYKNIQLEVAENRPEYEYLAGEGSAARLRL